MRCDTCGRTAEDPKAIFCSNPHHLAAIADRTANELAKQMIANVDRACEIGHNALMEVAQGAEAQPTVTIAQPFGILESTPTPSATNAIGHTPSAMRTRIRNLRRAIRQLQKAHDLTRCALELSAHQFWQMRDRMGEDRATITALQNENRDLREKLHVRCLT